MQTKALVISILLPLLSAAAVVLTHYVIRSEEAKSDAFTFIFQVVPYCFLDTYDDENHHHHHTLFYLSLLSQIDIHVWRLLVHVLRSA